MLRDGNTLDAYASAVLRKQPLLSEDPGVSSVQVHKVELNLLKSQSPYELPIVRQSSHV